ncbi:MAG TPA: RagB/SusD family nutrient uptake outer membrane protein [Niabella sp.]|nr:RagB/SusD family nutrient uptake outer membrane protein [Niabella sp.]HQX20864.1 RagB/SusD family nutrient uptake outer membrane protein [Niabella sp.]HQX41568.1 RagB/SusD family nutrient uptake outer membrane protein [Niabella sp.]HRB08344.1 RagB/SusD family nutrient uptake outer membrane protein [Niabella sp.]HRB48567.1 RagB/SusD family nutrient uptake outer membrane protein [Niabella sp.]
MFFLNNNLQKIKSLVVLIMLFTGIASCNKQLDTESTRVGTEAANWDSYDDARSGLISIYGLFRAALADNNGHWLLGELRNGDFASVSRPDLKAIINGNLSASYNLLDNVTDWRRFYAVINTCNVFIEKSAGCLVDQRYTKAYHSLDMAQARAMRAFAYFYMVRVWGDVPLITTSGEGKDFEKVPRADKNAVLSFAEKELIAVAPDLPYLYSVAGEDFKFPNNYYDYSQTDWAGRPFSRIAAYSLLAHITAWKEDYVNTAIYTEFILNNFSKSRLSTVSVSDMISPQNWGLFNRGQDGAVYYPIFSLSFRKQDGEATTNGHFEQLSLANTTKFAMSKLLPDIYIPKNVIADMFANTNGKDQRFGIDPTATEEGTLLETYFENYNAEIPIFKKIRIVDDGANTGMFAQFTSSLVFTRLEEIRLLRAEAMAVLGKYTDATTLLNSVRASRGLDNTLGTSTNRDMIIKEIFAERRRELVGEGWHWYDQIRQNRILRNDPSFNTLLDQDGIYWPIAQEVLNRNPLIVQNTYWSGN